MRILEPGLTVQTDVPIKNLVALVEAARDYRRAERRILEVLSDAAAFSHALRLGGIATLGLLVPVFAASVETLPDGFPTRRGELVFFRANVFERPSEHQALFDWLGRFDLLVTNGHGLADEQTRKTLQSGGSKLFLYAWANGFYVYEAERQQQDGQWRSDLVDNHRDWLLCAEPMGSQMGPLAYYFDFSKPEMVDYFAQRLAEYRADRLRRDLL